MCLTKEEAKALLDNQNKIEECNEKVITMVEEIGDSLKRLETDIGVIKPMVEKNSLLLTGNGNPEHGVSFRLAFMEKWVMEHEDKFVQFMKKQEETKQRKSDKLWSVAQPIIVEALKILVLGGGLLVILNNLS